MKTSLAVTLLAVVALVATATSRADDKKKDKLAGVKCPVSGKAVKAESSVDYKGGKAYFCCDGCPTAFAKSTAKYAAKANHQLVATGQATLEKCPIAGRKLNPATKITVDGVDVCFCCNGCKGKATKAEDKIEFIFNDAAFGKGYKVNAKK
jgi:YHS domain-containing protein